ncbi:WXG100 family type VII secretion target [Salinispora tropica]|uniref:Uncharacterized protein n=1 Tax=Salinispora tropica (strain ATCC BAA-916 / DSM 44818 / JCM 13857 / NBRC 105044 / CNB-440) TaxID=369723 RepID=A4XD02_SALTO|nr:type VII secretion target [Salinispora tropica]ABP56809.1 hypothetical protein Strop_4381 [Salinispora tropica CNB-440]
MMVHVRYRAGSHEGEVLMHPGFAVDVEALQSIGAKVAAAAGTLRESVPAAGAGLAPPRSGSAAAVAAQTAEKVWLAELRRLAERVDGFGADLTASAQDYLATDEANADGLRRTEVPPR